MARKKYAGIIPSVTVPSDKKEANLYVNAMIDNLQDRIFEDFLRNKSHEVSHSEISLVSGNCKVNLKNLFLQGYSLDDVEKIIAIEYNEYDGVNANNGDPLAVKKTNDIPIVDDPEKLILGYDPPPGNGGYPPIEPINTRFYLRKNKTKGDLVVNTKQKTSGSSDGGKTGQPATPNINTNTNVNFADKIIGEPKERKLMRDVKCITGLDFTRNDFLNIRQIREQQDEVALFLKETGDRHEVLDPLIYNANKQLLEKNQIISERDQTIADLNARLVNDPKKSKRPLLQGENEMEEITILNTLDNHREAIKRDIGDVKRDITDVKRDIEKMLETYQTAVTKPIGDLVARLETVERSVTILNDKQAQVCENGQCYITNLKELNATLGDNLGKIDSGMSKLETNIGSGISGLDNRLGKRIADLQAEINAIKADTSSSIKGSNQLVTDGLKKVCNSIDCLNERFEASDNTVECECGNEFIWDNSLDINICPVCDRKYRKQES